MEVSANIFVLKYSEELLEFGVYGKIVISRRWMEIARYFAQEHNLGKTAGFVVKSLLVYPFQPIETWKWLINAWFGINIGSLSSKVKGLIPGTRD
jgi:hypothetical protein